MGEPRTSGTATAGPRVLRALLVVGRGLGRLRGAAPGPLQRLPVHPVGIGARGDARRNGGLLESTVRAWTADPAVAPGHVEVGSATAPGDRLVRWAGRLIALYGGAHTLGALTVEGAARHAGAWFSGELRGADLSRMSPAGSAYWLSVMSFGPQLVLLGLTVSWLGRHGITPPEFVAWALGTWTAVDLAVSGPESGQSLVLLLAVGLLLVGARRTAHGARLAALPAGRSPGR